MSVSQEELEFYTKKESGKYDFQTWESNLTQSQSDRSANWNDKAIVCWKIRSNDLPVRKEMSNMPNYNDVYFVDNKIKQGLIWKSAVLLGGDIDISVKGYDSLDDRGAELLETEINKEFIKGNYVHKMKPVIDDGNYVGLGFSRMVWDSEDINAEYITGRPKMMAVDARNVWFTTLDTDPFQLNSIWHVKELKVTEIKKAFGKKAENVQAFKGVMDGLPKTWNNDTAYLVYHQYKKDVTVKKVEITNNETGTREVLLEKEIEDTKKEVINDFALSLTGERTEDTNKSNDIIRRFLEIRDNSIEPTIEEFTLFIENGGLYPEGIYESKPIKVKKEIWYEVIYVYSSQIILQNPTATGETSDYQMFYLGEKQDGSNYPVSTAYDLYPLQEQSILLNTSLTYQAFKLNKPTPVVSEGALVDEEEFATNYWKLNYMAVISSEWEEKHPGRDAIKWETPPINAALPLTLKQTIDEAIKTRIGSIDSARGIQSYANQSGVLASNLQQASNTYIRSDEMKVHLYIQQVADWLKDRIPRYRSEPFKTIGLTEDNEMGMVDVNTMPENSITSDNYYCEVTIETTPEDKRFASEQKNIQLFQMGLQGNLDTLKGVNVDNPEKINENKIAEDQQRQYGLALEELSETNPEAFQAVMQVLEQNSNGSAENK